MVLFFFSYVEIAWLNASILVEFGFLGDWIVKYWRSRVGRPLLSFLQYRERGLSKLARERPLSYPTHAHA